MTMRYYWRIAWLLVLCCVLRDTSSAADEAPLQPPQVETLSPDSAIVLSGAETLKNSGQFAEAQLLLETALAQSAEPETQQQLRAALADVHKAWGDSLKKAYAYQDVITQYEAAIVLDRSERPKEAAAALTELGEVYYFIAQYEKAIHTYEDALVLQRQIGNRPGEGTTLNHLGQAYMTLGQNEKAVEHLQHALAIYREVHDRGGEGRVLDDLGGAYESLNQMDVRAIDYREQAVTILREVRDREGEAESLNDLGGAYMTRFQFEKALTYFGQALAIARDLHNRRQEGEVLGGIGFVHTFRAHYLQATEYFQQALAIAQSVQNRLGEWRALAGLGTVAMSQGQVDRQREYHEQALTLARDLKLTKEERISLFTLGRLYVSLSQYNKGIDYYETALAMAREQHDVDMESLLLGSLSGAYFALSEAEKAIAASESALTLARERGNQQGEALALSNLGVGYVSLGQYEKAIAHLEPALALRRKQENRREEATILINLGWAYSSLSQYDQATAYYELAVTLARNIKSRPLEGSALNNLSTIALARSQYAKAVTYLEPALVIAREVKDKASEGLTLGNLGVAYHGLGQYEKAIAFSGQALTVAQDVKNRRGAVAALNNLAEVYRSLGQASKEIPSLEAALHIAQEIKDRSGEARIIGNLSSTYEMLQQHQKAIAYAEQALAICREIQDQQCEGVSLSRLGSTYASMKQFEKARSFHEQSLTISRELKDRQGEGSSLGNLGTIHFSLQQWQEARFFYEQALPLLREVQNPAEEGIVLTDLMNVWFMEMRPRVAIFYGKQAVNVYQELRGNIQSLPKEQRQSFLLSKTEVYRTLAGLLIAEGRLPEAQQVLDLLKTEEYFEFVRRDAKAIESAQQQVTLTATEKTWEQRYREIAGRVMALGSERGALLDKEKNKILTEVEKQRLTQLDADLEVARRAFQHFLDSLEQEADVATDKGTSVSNVREAQNLMSVVRKLGAGTVVLYTLVGAEKYRVIVITADARTAREYAISRAELNRKVLAFREILQNPHLDPLPAAQELYRILIDPIAADLQGAKAQTLMWSLDGALRYLPISALHDGQHYLIERYRSVVFTPASQVNLQDQPNPQWQVLGLGVSKAHEDFPPLFAVPAELHGIIRAEKTRLNTGVLPGVVMLDEAFTQQSMVTALRNRYPVVHIASHFRFHPGNEDESYLLLGDGSRLSVAGLKRGYDTLFADVDLLALSACETAVSGEDAEGKEVEGFGVLAQQQGAKAVLATLWSVADQSTREFMVKFYRSRQAKGGISKAEALRQAQLAMLRGVRRSDTLDKQRGVVQVSHDSPNTDGQSGTAPQFVKDPAAPYAHPYHWAPFILIGNWR